MIRCCLTWLLPRIFRALGAKTTDLLNNVASTLKKGEYELELYSIFDGAFELIGLDILLTDKTMLGICLSESKQ